MTGLDIGQLKRAIVAPTLAAISPRLASAAAINLVTGTAYAESGAAYLEQIDGPALGLWQMEPATHDDCWVNFLCFPQFSWLATPVRQMLAPDLPPVDQLVTNLRYACAMARIRYYRSPAALPDADDAAGLSAYHKAVYNTVLGAADPAANVAVFAQAIAA